MKPNVFPINLLPRASKSNERRCFCNKFASWLQKAMKSAAFSICWLPTARSRFLSLARRLGNHSISIVARLTLRRYVSQVCYASVFPLKFEDSSKIECKIKGDPQNYVARLTLCRYVSQVCCASAFPIEIRRFLKNRIEIKGKAKLTSRGSPCVVLCLRSAARRHFH